MNQIQMIAMRIRDLREILGMTQEEAAQKSGVLLEHPAVLECAITGVPDPLRGQIVKATVVLKPGYEPSDEMVKDLQNHVKHLTAPYKYPRKVEFVAELPKTISGKVRRFEIRNKDKEAQ